MNRSLGLIYSRINARIFQFTNICSYMTTVNDTSFHTVVTGATGLLGNNLVRQLLNRRMPGVPPGSFSIVDARDVAEASIRVAERGRRSERYLAAGRPMTMKELMAE